MFGIVFKILGSLLVAFVFFALIVVKNAVNEEGGGEEDNDLDTPGNQVYPPHMWKGLAVWLGVIYSIINLIGLAMSF